MFYFFLVKVIEPCCNQTIAVIVSTMKSTFKPCRQVASSSSVIQLQWLFSYWIKINKYFFAARLIKKKFLLPVLLGLKLKMATLVPLIFGLLVLLAKKIVFVSKLAMILGTALGLSSLLFGLSHLSHQSQHQPQYYPPDHYHGTQQYHPTTFSHPYKGYCKYNHTTDTQTNF